MKKNLILAENCNKKESLYPELYDKLATKCKVVANIDPIELINSSFKKEELFGFVTPGIFYDLSLTLPLDSKICKELPEEYLLLEHKQTFNISIVRQNKAKLIFQSPFSEKLVLRAIKGKL